MGGNCYWGDLLLGEICCWAGFVAGRDLQSRPIEPRIFNPATDRKTFVSLNIYCG